MVSISKVGHNCKTNRVSEIEALVSLVQEIQLTQGQGKLHTTCAVPGESVVLGTRSELGPACGCTGN